MNKEESIPKISAGLFKLLFSKSTFKSAIFVHTLSITLSNDVIYYSWYPKNLFL